MRFKLPSDVTNEAKDNEEKYRSKRYRRKT